MSCTRWKHSQNLFKWNSPFSNIKARALCVKTLLFCNPSSCKWVATIIGIYFHFSIVSYFKYVLAVFMYLTTRYDHRLERSKKNNIKTTCKKKQIKWTTFLFYVLTFAIKVNVYRTKKIQIKISCNIAIFTISNPEIKHVKIAWWNYPCRILSSNVTAKIHDYRPYENNQIIPTVQIHCKTFMNIVKELN